MTTCDKVDAITIESDRNQLCIDWRDGHKSRFHFVWLRHSEFFSDTLSTSRVEDCKRLPDDPRTLRVNAAELSDTEILLHWEGGVPDTTYSLKWLRDNCYSSTGRQMRRHQPVLWTGSEAQACPRFDWGKIAAGDTDLLFDLTITIRDTGFARVVNTHTREGSIADIASHFGPVITTHLGPVFDVKVCLM